MDNQKFIIKDEKRSLNRDESIQITFIATKPPSSLGVKYSNFIRKLKLNSQEICDNSESLNVSCAELEVIDESKADRFHGILTLYPKYSSDALQVIIEVDNPALALGVSHT